MPEQESQKTPEGGQEGGESIPRRRIGTEHVTKREGDDPLQNKGRAGRIGTENKRIG